MQATVDFIRNSSGSALSVPGDVTDPSFPARLVQAAVDKFGALHILVNNAGEAGASACVALKYRALTQGWRACGSVVAMWVDGMGWGVLCDCRCLAPCAAVACDTLLRPTRRPLPLGPAGFTWDGMAHKMGEKQWQAMLDVHCTAPFRLIQVRRRDVAAQPGWPAGWQARVRPVCPPRLPCRPRRRICGRRPSGRWRRAGDRARAAS